MKKIIYSAAIAAVAMAAAPAYSQLPALQDFTGLNLAELNGQGGWNFSGTNTTPVINVTTGDVDIVGLPAQSGDRSITIEGLGQDVGLSFGSAITPTGGALYASFAIVVTATAGNLDADTPPTNPSASNNDDDYFFHFTEGILASGSGFRGRTFIDRGATGFYLGVRTTSGDPGTYAPTEYAFGTPTFVVVKLNFNPGITDDTVQIFVNQAVASEPVSADATEATAIDFAAIGRIGFRQDSVLETPNIRIDQVRVGETWASVVPVAPSAVSDWSMFN